MSPLLTDAEFGAPLTDDMRRRMVERYAGAVSGDDLEGIVAAMQDPRVRREVELTAGIMRAGRANA